MFHRFDYLQFHFCSALTLTCASTLIFSNMNYILCLQTPDKKYLNLKQNKKVFSSGTKCTRPTLKWEIDTRGNKLLNLKGRGNDIHIYIILQSVSGK